MATRDVGASDLGPGAITGTQLSPGAIGAQSIMGSPQTFQSSLDSAIAQAMNIDLNDPATARFFQTILRDAGYYTGPIDGIWGPMSQRANEEYQANGMQPKPAAPTPAPTLSSGGGSGSSGGSGGGGSVTFQAPSLPPVYKPASIDEAYPEFGAFLNIPEVRAILDDALQNGRPPAWVSAAVRQSNWWKTTTPAKRNWIAFEVQDPAAAKAKIRETTAGLKQMAGDYLLRWSDQTAQATAMRFLQGDLDETGLRDELTNQALSLFGENAELAGALKAGKTVRDFARPFVDLAANELELGEDAIDLMDPKWQKALSTVDPSGARRPMTLYEWQTTIRSDSVYGWDKTSKARGEAAQFAGKLAETFGRI